MRLELVQATAQCGSGAIDAILGVREAPPIAE